jgi:hypothetical protein
MALPFKIFVACIEGLDATIHSDTPFSLLKFVYAVASAGVYVIAIPTGLFLACQPTSWITNIQTARTILSSVNIPAELQLFAEQL